MGRERTVRERTLSLGMLIVFVLSSLPMRAFATPSDGVRNPQPGGGTGEQTGTSSSPIISDGSVAGTPGAGSPTSAVGGSTAVVDPASGQASYSLPISVPSARGEAEVNLALVYGSSSGTGDAGEGISLNLPSIERRVLSGTPHGFDPAVDRYYYAGQPLAPICVVQNAKGSCVGASGSQVGLASETTPLWANGWTLFREEHEHSFSRYYLSADKATWRVLSKNGITSEFGAARVPSGITVPLPKPWDAATDYTRGNVPYRWRISRTFDSEILPFPDGTILAANTIRYQWDKDHVSGLSILTDVFDTQRGDGRFDYGTNDPLLDFAHHVHLTYEKPSYNYAGNPPIWKAVPYLRLARVDVTSAKMADSYATGLASLTQTGPTNTRELVRSYFLGYAEFAHHSYLRSFEQGGRCADFNRNPQQERADGALDLAATAACEPRLPASSFVYSHEPMTPNFGAPVTILSADRPNTDGSQSFAGPILDMDGDGRPDVLRPTAGVVWMNGKDGADGFKDVPFSCFGPVETISHDWDYVVDGQFSPQPSTQQKSCDLLFSNRGDTVIGDWAGTGGTSALVLDDVTVLHQYEQGPCYKDPAKHAPRVYDRSKLASGRILFKPERGSDGSWSWHGQAIDAPAFFAGPNYSTYAFTDVDGDGNLDAIDLRTYVPGYSITPTGLEDYVSKRWPFLPYDMFRGESAGALHLSARASDGRPLPFQNNTGGGDVGFPFGWNIFQPVYKKYSTGDYFGERQCDADLWTTLNPNLPSFVDIDGDSTVDAVWCGSGQLRYAQGNGEGVFAPVLKDYSGTILEPSPGISLGTDCTLRKNSSDYPAVDYYADVTGDNLADRISLMVNGVWGLWVYPNRDGKSFGPPIALQLPRDFNGPTARVSFADENGNGVTDIVLFSGRLVSFYDAFDSALHVPNATRPGLLTTINNGLGATTTLTYSSTAELSWEAKNNNAPWQYDSPLNGFVVTSVTTDNHLDGALHRGGTVSYTYRDPAFDGVQHALLGFRTVIARTPAGRSTPSSDTQTDYFFEGVCQPGTAADVQVCTPNLKHPYRAIWGTPRARSVRATPLVLAAATPYESTRTGFELRALDLSMDGRTVYAALPHVTTTLSYPATSGAAGDVVPVEDVLPTGMTSVYPIQKSSIQALDGYFRRSTSFAYDDFGNVTSETASGNANGGSDTIVRKFRSELRNRNTWHFARTWESTQGGNGEGAREFFYVYYDGTAHLRDVTHPLRGTLPLKRRHVDGLPTADPPDFASQDGSLVLKHFEYDPYYGNVTKVIGGDGRCSRFEFDAAFQHLPTASMAYAGLAQWGSAGHGLVMQDGCASGTPQTSVRAYDRGLEALVWTMAPDATQSTVSYDAFGRIDTASRPNATAVGYVVGTAGFNPFSGAPSPSAMARGPSLAVDYQLAPNATIHRVHTGVQTGAGYRQAWAFLDGLGNTLLTLEQADGDGSGHALVARGGDVVDPNGLVSMTYQPWYTDVSPTVDGARAALADPNRVGVAQYAYDPIGRVLTAKGPNGMLARFTYTATSTDAYDAEDLNGGPHANTPSTTIVDSFGRTVRSITRQHRVDSAGNPTSGIDTVTTRGVYAPTGELTLVERSSAAAVEAGAKSVVRWMRHDSLGRMVLNVEPNTSGSTFRPDPTTDPNALNAWRYAYNNSGLIVGTSDARGCGKNIAYDGLGRKLTEDYSPCVSTQEPYSSAPEVTNVYDVANPSTDPSLASLHIGRLSYTADRAALTRYEYDARGRPSTVSRQLARPNAPDASRPLSERYAAHVFTKSMLYDELDRLTTSTTGADVPELLGNGTNDSVTVGYNRRGLVSSVTSAWGDLLTSQRYDALARVREEHFGDGAQTVRTTDYDRLTGFLTFSSVTRKAPALWRSPTSTYIPASPNDSGQLTLEKYTFETDAVGNPRSIDDGRADGEWADGAKPTSRKMTYDDSYRLRDVQYVRGSLASPGAPDRQTPLFVAKDAARFLFPARGANSLPAARVQRQSFTFDWQGNLTRSTDDDLSATSALFDRSLGDVAYTAEGPNRAGDGTSAQKVWTRPKTQFSPTYDDSGNTTSISIAEVHQDLLSPNYQTAIDNYSVAKFAVPKAKTYSCPGSSVFTKFRTCKYTPTQADFDAWQRRVTLASGAVDAEVAKATTLQHFVYEWNEVGQLEQARTTRTDLNGNPLAPAVDVQFAYSAGGARVLKFVTPEGGETRTNAEVFDSLRLSHALWQDTDYERTAVTESVYVGGIGHVVYAEAGLPGSTSSHGEARLFLVLGDHLGSSSIVLDQKTGELVERATYQAFGGADSDYRSDRWQNFREAYRFTGKEDDTEIGLTYFGARYYSPALGRWISPDPLTIHALGADPNPYAYVGGSPLAAVDPFGLATPPSGCLGAERCGGSGGGAGGGNPPNGGIVLGSGGTGGEPSIPSAAANWMWDGIKGLFGGSSGTASPVPDAPAPLTHDAGAFAMPAHGGSFPVSGTIYETSATGGGAVRLDMSAKTAGDFAKAMSNETVDHLAAGLGLQLQVFSMGAADGAGLAASAAGLHFDTPIEPAAQFLMAGVMLFSPGEAGGVTSGTYGALRSAGLKDAHHIIQDAAVRDLAGYSHSSAPAVQLAGPSTRIGTPHWLATQVQRQAGGGTYAAERRIAYKALRKSGIGVDDTRQLIFQADGYFESIGVTGDTVTRIPGNR